MVRGCCLDHKDSQRLAEVMGPASCWREKNLDSNVTSFQCNLFLDHTSIMQCCPQKCQAASSHSPHDRVLPYESTNTEKPVPTKPDEKVRRELPCKPFSLSLASSESFLGKLRADHCGCH